MKLLVLLWTALESYGHGAICKMNHLINHMDSKWNFVANKNKTVLTK